MSIWGKRVLGSGNSKCKNIGRNVPGAVEELHEVAAAERVKRIADGGQRGNTGQITQSCRPL